MSISGRYITIRGGNVIGTPPAIPLLLDLYPATVAYSVRKLRNTYTGACIRVRRSIDNAEQDIGFVGNDLDTASLLLFVGVNDGFVTTWYDQQGSNNLAQSTLNRQPIIVNSGSIINEGTKPSLNFARKGVNEDNLFVSTSSFSGNSSLFSVTSFYDTVNKCIFFSKRTNSNYILYPDTVNPSIPSSNSFLSNAFINSVLTNVFTRGDARTAMLGKRMLISILNYNMGAFTNYELGRDGSSIAALDHYQELVIYSTDQSVNRTAIETNINNYYGIYP